jgi:hypothetical protein
MVARVRQLLRATEASHLFQIIMANAKRIAWTVALQQVVRFPGHFLAPLKRPQAHRPRIFREADTEGHALPYHRTVTLAAAGAQRALTYLKPRWSRLAMPPNVSNPQARFQSRAEGYAMPSSTPARLNAASPSTHQRNPRGFAASLIPRIVNPKGTFTLAGRHQLGPSAVLGGSLAPRQPSFLAPHPMPLPLQGHQDLKQPWALSADVTDSVMVRSRPRYSAPPGQFEPGFHVTSQPHFRTGDTEAGTAPSGDQPAKPIISTLHIDGAALGRWAIQHLERALGRPATGMTGIDPRVSPPRSRVSPF